MSNQSKKILVTGSGGFIGQHLVRQLHNLDIETFEIRNRNDCDLCDYEAVQSRIQQIKPGVVVHLAASPDAGKDILHSHTGFRNTVNCTLNVLYAIPPTWECLFIYVGSYKQYGNIPIPFKEHHHPNPISAYGLAKQSAENLVRIRESPKFRAVYLRVGSVYGPMQPQNAFLSRAIQAALRKDISDLAISNLLWDPIYISDVIDAICCCIVTPRVWGHTINISSGVPHTPLAFFRQIMVLMYGDPDFLQCKVENNGYLPCLGDIHLAKEIMNWQPKVELTIGLERLISAYIGL